MLVDPNFIKFVFRTHGLIEAVEMLSGSFKLAEKLSGS